MLNLFLRWFAFAIALLFVAWIMPGITLTGLLPAMWAVMIIGVINIFIRPVLIILTIPINILTLGLFTLIINGLLFLFASHLVSGFVVSGFWAAFFGSILLSIFSMFINRFDVDMG